MAKKDEEQNINEKTAAAVGAMTFEQMLELMKIAVASKGTDPAMLAIAESLQKQAVIDEQRFRKENMVNPGISEFSHPEGTEKHPRHRLHSLTIFANAVQDEEQLMDIEVDLFNKIKSNKTARKGKWTAIYEPPIGDAKKGKLTISLNTNLNSPDSVIGIPSLVQILTELSTGQDATNVAKLFQQIADLQEQVKGFAQAQANGAPELAPV